MVRVFQIRRFLLYSLPFVFSYAIASGGSAGSLVRLPASTLQTNNAAYARRFVQDVLGRGDMTAFNQLVDEHIIVNSGIRPLAPINGKTAFRKALGALSAFSHGTLEIEDIVAVNDRVIVRYKAVADHTGPQLGVTPTGKRITMWEIRMMRWRGGRLVEDYVADINYDWPWLVKSAYPDAIGKTGLRER